MKFRIIFSPEKFPNLIMDLRRWKEQRQNTIRETIEFCKKAGLDKIETLNKLKNDIKTFSDNYPLPFSYQITVLYQTDKNIFHRSLINSFNFSDDITEEGILFFEDNSTPQVHNGYYIEIKKRDPGSGIVSTTGNEVLIYNNINQKKLWQKANVQNGEVEIIISNHTTVATFFDEGYVKSNKEKILGNKLVGPLLAKFGYTAEETYHSKTIAESAKLNHNVRTVDVAP